MMQAMGAQENVDELGPKYMDGLFTDRWYDLYDVWHDSIGSGNRANKRAFNKLRRKEWACVLKNKRGSEPHRKCKVCVDCKLRRSQATTPEEKRQFTKELHHHLLTVKEDRMCYKLTIMRAKASVSVGLVPVDLEIVLSLR